MPENKKRMNKAVIYTLAILVVVALIGIVGYFFAGRDRSTAIVDTREFVPYPTINASISSSADGNTHTLDVDFVLQFPDNANVPHDVVYETMQNAVAEIDYEALKRNDSVEMLEASVKEAIEDVVGVGGVENVYVGNIVIDFPNMLETAQQPDDSNADRLKGLFKNMQD